LEVVRPEIYYGERTDQYVITNTRLPEFNYPMGSDNATTTYQGAGGVPLATPLHRLAFAARFGTTKLLLSSDITSESRVHFRRNVMERVGELAPFFHYDPDPYLVVHEGRLYWIIDAYTTTSYYPYARPYRNLGNYIRNSVKVVVDAYNGHVTFYLVDEGDPLAVTYGKIYPELLTPISQMPPGLFAHLRYPERLFEIQSDILALYHMRNTTVFYNQEDLWERAREIVWGTEQQMSPYYTIMRLPGEEQAEFVLMLPFTPTKRNNMIAWFAARSDGDKYGQLLLYRFPKQELVYGPAQIEARIDQDSFISQQLTLWGQTGSRVLRGNLLVIPIKNQLLYVEPLFIQAEQSQLPELKMVIVAYGNRIVMEPTLEEALELIFGQRRLEEQRPEPRQAEEKTATQDLIGRVVELYRQVTASLQGGDWSAYGRYMELLEKAILELAAELEGDD
ncbi:MAG: UPF0182 family protein, partial [Limnochordia bacterium]